MFKAPEFWYHKTGRAAAPALRTALSPLGWLYAKATAKKLADTIPVNVGVPVICVGNATVGGSGKTPVTRYLLESFTRLGIRTVGLSRGYGGREKGPVRVTSKHTYKDVGDEPLLLAGAAPVWVAAGRDEGARAAVAGGAQLIVMDDGHQNPLLMKTLSLLVLDAETGFGNGRVFPAGPLREPATAALARADAVILMKPSLDFRPEPDLLHALAGKIVIPAHLKPLQKPPEGKVFAFAGIGRPQKFFDALRRAGADLVDALAFANHKAYAQTDLKNLLDLAGEYKAQLITTEKDYVRLPKGFARHVTSWPVKVEFEDELTLRRILHPVIESVRR